MKTTQKYSRSNIAKNAWKLVKEHGVSFSTAMKYAWAFAKSTISKVMYIVFSKKDGTKTERIGRVDGITQTNKNCLTFFDYSKGRFSRAIISNIKEMTAVQLAA